jgi:hypothetical protein
VHGRGTDVDVDVVVGDDTRESLPDAAQSHGELVTARWGVGGDGTTAWRSDGTRSRRG